MSKALNRIACISGATSGIGRATARLFAKRGYRLILMARRMEKLLEIQERFQKKYAIKVQVLPFDIRDKSAAKKAYTGLPTAWKKVDILVNNAGLAKGFHDIHRGRLEDWEAMIDTNIKGLLYLTRLIVPGMTRRRKGHIINVCSSAGHEVYPKGNVYCATKHAVDALTKSMRLDLFKHGIRVSQVSPGHVEDTEFALVRFDGDSKKAQIYQDFNPLTAKDVAETILFIASRPKHVNIQDVVLMGSQQASNNHIDRSGRKYD